MNASSESEPTVTAGNGWKRLAGDLLSLVYPLHCLSCGAAPEEWSRLQLCADCDAGYAPLPQPSCRKCDLPAADFRVAAARCHACEGLAAHFTRAYAATLYQEPVKSAIAGYKFHGRREAARIFAGLLNRTLRQRMPDADRARLQSIAVVPTHPNSIQERGYCHMDLIAGYLSTLLNIPYARQALMTQGNRPPQFQMPNPPARFRNVEGAFLAPVPDRIRDRQWLLLDDVMTTGATAAAASKALIQAGAAAVTVAVIARTPEME